MSMELHITARPVGEHAEVKPVGVLDTETASELAAFLGEALEHGWTRLAVDLTQTECVDMAALRTLADAARQAHRHGGCFHLTAHTGLPARRPALDGALASTHLKTKPAGSSPPLPSLAQSRSDSSHAVPAL